MATTVHESLEELAPDDSKEFEHWNSRLEYMLSSLALCIGLGNLWRFPYVAYESDGGSFFWVYTLVVIFIVTPLYLFEATIGQLNQLLQVKLYKFFPMTRGVGLQHALASLGTAVSYHVVLSYAVLYMYHSVMNSKEWLTCPPMEPRCVQAGPFGNHSIPLNVTPVSLKAGSSEDFFWYEEVLDSTTQFRMAKPFDLGLSISGLLAWISVAIYFFIDFKTAAKCSLFLVSIPFLATVVIFQNAIRKEGSLAGLFYFLAPKAESFFSIHTWRQATVQACYSLGVGTSAVVILAGHNSVNYNVVKTNILTVLLDYLYSIVSAIIVFSVLGNVSKLTGVPVGELYNNSVGLVFTAYPRAAEGLWLPQFWTLIFFFSMASNSIVTEVRLVQVWVRNITHAWPMRKSAEKAVIWLFLVVFFFLTCPGLGKDGIFYAQWIDQFCGSFPLLAMACYEVFYFRFGYGREKYKSIVHYTGSGFNSVFFDFQFVYILPFFLLWIVLFGLVDLVIETENMYWRDNLWAYVTGWALFSLLPLPSLVFSLMWLCRKGSTWEVEDLSQYAEPRQAYIAPKRPKSEEPAETSATLIESPT